VTALHRTPGAWLLHAIAAEIDNRGATLVPDARVCRACGGRGETIVALDQGRFIDPAFMAACRRNGWGGTGARQHVRVGADRYRRIQESADQTTRIVVLPCDCEPSVDSRLFGLVDTNKRPDTVSLAWLVAWLADQRTPAFEWPAQWLVDMDMREAKGDRSWQAVWWAQFYAWTRGVALDEERLRWALDQARPRPKPIDWINIKVDLTNAASMSERFDAYQDRREFWGESLAWQPTGGLGAGDGDREAWERSVEEQRRAMFTSRRTGRTRRLIEEAATAVANGERVMVVGTDHRQAQDLAVRVSDHLAENGLGRRRDGVSYAGMATACEDLRGSSFVPFVDHRVWETMGSRDALDLAREITAVMDRIADRGRARMRVEAGISSLDETVRAGMMTPEDALAALVRAGVLTDEGAVIP
jgi:hypothetical protein